MATTKAERAEAAADRAEAARMAAAPVRDSSGRVLDPDKVPDSDVHDKGKQYDQVTEAVKGGSEPVSKTIEDIRAGAVSSATNPARERTDYEQGAPGFRRGLDEDQVRAIVREELGRKP